jgi:predicted DNA-binding transcriptional regulator YafY
VEPIAFTDNYTSICAFEEDTQKNKYFNVERITDVEQLDAKQEYKNLHKLDPVDVFGFTEWNGEKFYIQLRLSLRAYVILKEEYPLVHPYLKKEPNKETYLLECNVNNPKTITRFILGFPKDVEVVGSEKYKSFITLTHEY